MVAFGLAQGQSEVRFAGALKNSMHQGDLSEKVRLDSLNTQGIYGLGAATDLRGEWVIWDGQAWLSRVEAGKIVTERRDTGSATLLVWSKMPCSLNGDTSISFKDEASLQQAIIAMATARGIDIREPFPFWLEGEAEINWHVINWPAGDSVHTHEKHQKAGIQGRSKLKNAQIIGFYSPKHAGIFTHHSTRLHMHLLDTNAPLAAHIDGIKGKKMSFRIGDDCNIRSYR
jgi:acetolactate decarboxylase